MTDTCGDDDYETKTYKCGWCHKDVPWFNGCADELFDMCDDCACLFLPLYDHVDSVSA